MCVHIIGIIVFDMKHTEVNYTFIFMMGKD